MIALYWNVRGFGNSDTKIALKNFYLSHKPTFIFLAEPMISFSHVPSWYWHGIGVNKCCLNNRGPRLPNLWALWNDEVPVVVIFNSDQCIALEVTWQNSSVFIAVIYANTSYLYRRLLWADLTHLQGCFLGPWLFIGDFNAVMGAHEKRGRWPPTTASCSDFGSWSNANLLTHLPSSGPLITWSNGRMGSAYVALRLDRSICNEEWLAFWRVTSCCTLIRHQSDHHPLLLSADVASVKYAIPFKFYKAWSSHVDCRKLVLENWAKNVRGVGMVRLQGKLQNLKMVFK
ncbi:putative endonuclease/exonuclease/phosphatase [Medicago truncatula]|uniref:Putative endonuclease/exonuclease/phosphatase n=1 Tax=Medicago truncatula TaxID=3880 RepID=A0A396JE43_MEDTR|nr:putative endonuclease/exonuclease/phosphatase [Medicago truncatula]